MHSRLSKISFIIPTYNVEPWVEECLLSILAVDLNIEIIVVDDGSTDETVAVVKSIQNENLETIKLISKSNGGQSSARNIGIQESTGKYLVFVDSDDYITPVEFIQLFDFMISNELEIACGNAVSFGNEQSNCIIKNASQYENLKGISGKELLENFFSNGQTATHIWTRIYSRELVVGANIDFLEGHYHEDIAFSLESMLASKRVGLKNVTFYHYRVRPGSTMHTMTRKNGDDILAVISKVSRKIQEEEIISKPIDDYLIYQCYLAWLNFSVRDLSLVSTIIKRGNLSLKKYIQSLIILLKLKKLRGHHADK